jgi:hypothetical protein
MQEYGKKIAENEEPNQVHTADTAHLDKQNLPSYLTLADQYKLEDDHDMHIGGRGSNKKTVEQEYHNYVTGSLSYGTVDILKFWEVNSDVI